MGRFVTLQKQKVRTILRYIGFLVSVCGFVFIVLDHSEVFDSSGRVTMLKEVAARFNLSYTPDASKPVDRGDPEWSAVMSLIYRYSKADFPKDKDPQVLARDVAVLSAKGDLGSEWTAPSTRLLLLYKPWPGNSMGPEDYRVVGSIGDFQDWITKDQARHKFLVHDVFVGGLSLVVGFLALFF